jgi:hypothetical protein
MNRPTKSVTPPLSPRPAHRRSGACKTSLHNADAIVDGFLVLSNRMNDGNTLPGFARRIRTRTASFASRAENREGARAAITETRR